MALYVLIVLAAEAKTKNHGSATGNRTRICSLKGACAECATVREISHLREAAGTICIEVASIGVSGGPNGNRTRISTLKGSRA